MMAQQIKTQLRAGRAMRLGWLVAIIILVLLVADQALKIWVKTDFYLGEEMEILPWFKLKFIQNNGFAFGLEWFNKYVLTFFRIFAVAAFILAMRRLLKLDEEGRLCLHPGFFISFALIIAGAAGNIFDCVFYGEIFNNPAPPAVAEIFPQQGYAGWFEGRVVDMLYFPIFSFELFGRRHEFFEYIFNLADAAITVGTLLIILFYRSDFSSAIDAIFGKKGDAE